ncbi:MAG: PH domain-containing protein [Nitriliruptorales bacterium]
MRSTMPSDPRREPHQASPFARARRLHPASMLLGLNLRQLVQLFVFPALASPAGAQAATMVLVLVGIVGLVLRILGWWRFHYSFDGDVLRVDAGVLTRNHRALHVDRIQQVEVDRSMLQRLLGLAELRVETAGTSAEVEVDLRVVTAAEARALEEAIRAARARATLLVGPHAPDVDEREPLEPRRREVLRVPLRHVIIASLTGSRLLVFPAVMGGAFELAGENLDEWFETALEQLRVRAWVGLGETLDPLTIGLAAVAVVALWLVTAIVVGVLRDAEFAIEQVEEDLHVSRGLLSTRDSVLPLWRIQLVQVHRNWLRSLLGYVAVRVYSAGGSAQADRRVTIPLLPAAHVNSVIRELYPDSPGMPELTGHPRSAMRRAILRWLRPSAALVAAVWLPPFVWLEPLRVPVLGLLPAGVVLGVAEYRQLAHGMTERIIASRRGALQITISLAPVAKVQAVTIRANWFQRRLDLATVRVHLAGPGGDVEVSDAATDDARALQERLSWSPSRWARPKSSGAL